MVAINDMKMPKSCSKCPLLCGMSGEQCCSITGEPEFRIRDCPLVEIEERKKGKWIPHRAKYDETAPIYECSICHKNNGFENTNYCPHCGSKMDENERTLEYADAERRE